MQSSITVKMVLIIGAIFLSLYLLYPTYQISQMTDEEILTAEIDNRKEFLATKSKTINARLPQ